MPDAPREQCRMPGCEREAAHLLRRSASVVPVCIYHAELLRGSDVSIAPLTPPSEPAAPAAAATAPRIRVLVVDDNAAFRDAIRVLLDSQPDLKVVGVATDGSYAVSALNDHPADVVLMDVTMPGVGGAEATRRLRAAHPQVPVIGLTMLDEYWVERSMSSAGAQTLLCKDCRPEELFAAIRGAARGEFSRAG